MREQGTVDNQPKRQIRAPEWPTAVLRDLIAVSKDGEWGKAEAGEDLVEVVLVRGTDFDAVAKGDLSGLPIRHVQSRHVALKRLCSNDLVIETAGGSKDRPTGRTLFIHARLLARTSRPILCASFCRFIRANLAAVDPGYLYWYLQRLYAAGLMTGFHTQHTGVARFQWTDFAAATQVPLPPRAIQSRATAILAAFDELVEINKRRIELLEGLTRSLYREWFVRFRFPGHEDVELVDSELGAIPGGWEVRRLGDLAEVVSEGVSPSDLSPDETYVGLEHLPRRQTTLCEWGAVGSVTSRKLRFRRGDTLFGKIRPYFHKVVWAPFDGIASSDAIVIRPLRQAGALANAVMSSDGFVAEAVATSNGTKMPRADPTALLAYPVALPPIENVVTSDFERATSAWLELAAQLVSHNRHLAATRDLLLPHVVTGRLDISDVDLSDLLPAGPK